MANIVFALSPSMGSLHSSLKLAKSLRGRGHNVSYFGVEDSEEHVRRYGFEFHTIYRSWFPKGLTKEYNRIAATNGRLRRQMVRSDASRRGAFLGAVIAGKETDFQDLLGAIRPHLMIHIHADSLMVVLALLGMSCGVGTIYLRDVLGRSDDLRIPPIWSDIMPSQSLLTRTWTRLAWRKESLRKLALKVCYRFGYGMDIDGMIQQLAQNMGYPWSLVDRMSLPPYLLKLPELVLCPREFDFPHAEKPGRYYVEASVDLDRAGPSFPWERVEAERPLIYCALGTWTCFSIDKYVSFYQAVIDAARATPCNQWVLSVGDVLCEKNFKEVPENVIVVQRAPQVQILKRAALMVTHGGLNSVKECVSLGVPMVVFPLGYDEPGNAARVVYHGLGVKGDFGKVTSEMVRSLVATVQKVPHYRLNAQLMRSIFQQAEDRQVGLRLIEAMLENGIIL